MLAQQDAIGRQRHVVDALDLVQVARLDFEEPDFQRFPCLALAYAAAEAGCGASGRLNAANEVAVEAFLEGRIRFTDIPAVIDQVMQVASVSEPTRLEDVLAIDEEGRRMAREALSRLGRRL